MNSAVSYSDGTFADFIGPPKPEWHIVTVCPCFVIEVNCNGGGRRRVYADGRIINE
jgi:Uma2 family endonuclease